MVTTVHADTVSNCDHLKYINSHGHFYFYFSSFSLKKKEMQDNRCPPTLTTTNTRLMNITPTLFDQRAMNEIQRNIRVADVTRVPVFIRGYQTTFKMCILAIKRVFTVCYKHAQGRKKKRVLLKLPAVFVGRE